MSILSNSAASRFDSIGGLNDAVSAVQNTVIFTVVALILAIVATVLAFIFITPEKKYASLPKALQVVADVFNFKGLMIEKILKALYIFFTCFAVLSGFFGIFSNFLAGLLSMVLVPILIRFIFEFMMMAILAVKNIISINNKLQDKTAPKEENTPEE